MTILFLILIVISAVILGLVILIQNPKGGGLSSNVAGIGNQLMGVKQTTDVLERGTWLFAGIIGLLCVISVLFMDAGKAPNSAIDRVNTSGVPAQQQAPASVPPAAAPATLPADTNK